ncbi:MAG TPA: PEP-utilizing enzyme, partial [Acidimicrobiales bacterium]
LGERHRTAREASLVTASVAHVVAHARGLEMTTLADAEVLQYRRRLLDLAARTMAAEIAAATAAVDAYQSLERALAGRLGVAEASRQAQRLVAGALAGTDLPLERLERIAHRASSQPTVAEALNAPSWVDAQRALTRVAAGRELLREMRDWFDSVGSRAVLAGPRWDEEPSAAWLVLRANLAAVAPGARPPEAFAVLADHLRAQPGWTRTRVLTGQVVDVRLHALARLASDANELLVRREAVKAAGLSLGGVIRLVHLEIGRRLAARGTIPDAGDVDLLLDAELARALRGEPPDPRTVNRRRAWLQSCRSAGSLPVRFRGRAVPLDEGPAGVDALQGWGASPGQYQGRCRVLASVDTEGFRPGDVLVARSTDASWTPLFLLAGALVIEEGGPLSHAAIVARELSIPAVVNVPGALGLLHDGDEVSVDGDSGVVTMRRPTTPVEVAAKEAVPCT